MLRSAYAQMGQKASAMTCIEAVLGEWLWHVGYALYRPGAAGCQQPQPGAGQFNEASNQIQL